jgi:hypothetical protein
MLLYKDREFSLWPPTSLHSNLKNLNTDNLHDSHLLSGQGNTQSDPTAKIVWS